MYKTNTETLHLQNSTEDQNNSTSSNNKPEQIYHNEIYTGNKNFWIRGNDEGYFITFGNSMVCEKQKTIEQCKSMLENKDWDIILNTILVLINTLKPNTITELVDGKI